jgi:two-component system, OmpR family, sensor kinase
MRRRLVGSYVLLTGIALVVFTVPVTLSLDDVLAGSQEEAGLREARTVAVLLGAVRSDDEPADLVRGETAALASLRAALETETDGRVELFDQRGGSALGRPVDGRRRDRIAAALAGREQVDRVTDSVLGEPGLEVVVPARAADGAPVGAVRLTYPLRPITDQLRAIWVFRALVGLGTLLVATAIAFLLARSLTRPLRRLDETASRMARGDFTATTRLPDRAPVEMRRLADTLDSGARQLGALVSSQQAFVADASHQLRTPLTALRLSLDNLADEVSTPAAQRLLDQTTAEIARMNRLVNDLLQLARAQVDPARPVVVPLLDVVEDRRWAWAAAAADRDVTLTSAVAPAHRALVTPGHLQQVLDNLVDNAITAAPPGTAVEIGSAAADGALHLRVADRGPGMTAEQRRRAFDRFWRGRPGGSGLGLAIVKQLVEQNQGRVTLADRPGGGLVVTLALVPAPGGGADDG